MDLKEYGVNELNQTDSRYAGGGFWSAAKIASGHFLFYFLLQVAIDPQAHIDAFKEGWESAGN